MKQACSVQGARSTGDASPLSFLEALAADQSDHVL